MGETALFAGITLADVAKVLLGGLVTSAFILIRKRRVRLRWHVDHRGVATAAEHPAVGKIEVTMNGQSMRNIVISTISVENGYWCDFHNLVLRVSVPEQHVILRDEATRAGDRKQFAWTARFKQEVDVFLKHDSKSNASRPNVQTWREYEVPAFNRGDSATINLLVEAPPPQAPQCELATDEKGVVLVYRTGKEPDVIGVPTFTALGLGIIVSIPLAYVIVENVTSRWHPVLLVTLGVFLVAIGALVGRTYRLLRERFI